MPQDVFIVVSSIWEVWVDVSNQLLQQDLQSLAGASSLKAFRIIRITRVVRTVRIMRLFRFVMALRTMITSIASTLKSLFWATVLLTLIIYVFAVLFAQSVNDFDCSSLQDRERLACHRYFVDLPTTMLSLFMSIAGGVSWEEVIGPLGEISPAWSGMFLIYIGFTYFADPWLLKLLDKFSFPVSQIWLH